MLMAKCHPDRQCISSKTGLCKSCYSRKWRLEHIEQRKEYDHRYWIDNKNRISIRGRKNYIHKNYNLTLDQWTDIFEKQGKVCAICKTDDPKGRRGWQTDHDHSTGFARGILCHNCNIGIGNLQDSICILENAIEYLRKG
jgi:hypothetical protein